MDCSSKDVGCPQLLDLIPNDREWLVQRGEQRSKTQSHSHGSSEEKKLDLTLGPPGHEDYGTKLERDNSIISLGNFSSGANKGFTKTGDMKRAEIDWVMNNNGSQTQKLFSPASANPAVPNSSQKRTAPAPVVGWPPIRSFRKNLASSSSPKPISESPNAVLQKGLTEKPTESCQKGFFVKINMDGVPIGRKVDLKAYDSYEKLSSAVDELFRGLIAAQRDSSDNYQEGENTITGLLDGSGEYTLVYEDNEGDRMLVGDVPWHMFVSTVKRLRVLKTSELPTLCFGSKQEKIPLRVASK